MSLPRLPDCDPIVTFSGRTQLSRNGLSAVRGNHVQTVRLGWLIQIASDNGSLDFTSMAYTLVAGCAPVIGMPRLQAKGSEVGYVRISASLKSLQTMKALDPHCYLYGSSLNFLTIMRIMRFGPESFKLVGPLAKLITFCICCPNAGTRVNHYIPPILSICIFFVGIAVFVSKS